MAKRLFSRSNRTAKSKQVTGAPHSSKIPSLKFSMVVLVASIALFVVASVVWYRAYYSRPSVVLWQTLDKALNTPGVVKRVVRTTETGSTDVTSVTRFAGQPGIEIRTAIVQTVPGEDGAEKDVHAKAESLGTASGDYQRYTEVPDGGISEQQSAIFNKIVNTWVKTNENVSGKPGQLYIDNLLGSLPFGDLNAGQRSAMLDFARNGSDTREPIFTVDYSSVQKQTVNGRPQYTYQLRINAESYAKWYQQYFAFMGFGEFADQRYTSAVASALGLGENDIFTVTVDMWTRQITTISRGGADQASTDGTIETISSYGIAPKFDDPAQSLSSEEFQKIISEESQDPGTSGSGQ